MAILRIKLPRVPNKVGGSTLVYSIIWNHLVVASFKHLVRFLTKSDDEWSALVSNFIKACHKWTRFSRILGQEGADTRTSITFYRAVVQVTFLFGSENWVITPRTGQALGGFHHRVSCRLVGMQPQSDTAGQWY